MEPSNWITEDDYDSLEELERRIKIGESALEDCISFLDQLLTILPNLPPLGAQGGNIGMLPDLRHRIVDASGRMSGSAAKLDELLQRSRRASEEELNEFLNGPANQRDTGK